MIKMQIIYACADLIEVSPPVGLRTETFTVEQTTLREASNKVTKH